MALLSGGARPQDGEQSSKRRRSGILGGTSAGKGRPIVNWEPAGVQLAATIQKVLAYGNAITLGLTRDGGACCVTWHRDGAGTKAYAGDADELADILADIADWYEEQRITPQTSPTALRAKK